MGVVFLWPDERNVQVRDDKIEAGNDMLGHGILAHGVHQACILL